MLADIAIENLGVIPKATAELSDGLTVLTGETGAGKTMVVTGLRLLSGGRADASRVRTGSAQASVEGRFVIDALPGPAKQRIAEIAEATGAQVDENGEYIASRVVNASGRSKAYLGGRAVPASSLGDFSGELLTIHGQNDQLRLLGADKQREALDRTDPKIEKLLADYRVKYEHWKTLARDLEERTASKRQLAQEADRLEFAINEISTIDPQPGEEAELITSIKRLQDVDELREQVVTALAALDGSAALAEISGETGEEACASDLLGKAEQALGNSEDQDLKELSSRLSEATAIVSEVAGELGIFMSDLPADSSELEKLLQRQQDLKGLTRKYAPDIEGVIAWRDKAARKLAKIDISPEALEQLKKETAQAKKVMFGAAKKLSAARVRTASDLAGKVTEELHGLAMPKARFAVDISEVEPGPWGADEIEFKLAANSQAEPRQLATSASGGELSRVMLALEVILSSGSSGSTLVFDEVDAGVGGKAAVEIGRRLARLAQRNQVIVVTHLPQVAAFADTHLHVAKDVTDTSVTSGVETLTDERRVEELARMLAGLDNTETGRAHAQELLKTAREEVKTFRGA